MAAPSCMTDALAQVQWQAPAWLVKDVMQLAHTLACQCRASYLSHTTNIGPLQSSGCTDVCSHLQRARSAPSNVETLLNSSRTDRSQASAWLGGLLAGRPGQLHAPVPDIYLLSSCLNLRSSRS